MVMERSERIGGLHVRVTSPKAGATRGVVALAHGLCVSGPVWRNWAQSLAERGFEAWSLDFRGHGESDGRESVGRASIEDYAADLEVVLAHSGAQAVFGHNMGGLVAQVVAARVPLRGLVLVSSAAPKGIGGPSMLSLLWRELRPRYVRAMWRGKAWRPADDDVLATICGKLPTEAASELLGWIQDESGVAMREMVMSGIAVDAAAVRCPVLVVASTFDKLTPPARQRLIASQYRADYVEFAQHAHVPMLEPGWERPAAVIGRWLEEAGRMGETKNVNGARASARRAIDAPPEAARPSVREPMAPPTSPPAPSSTTVPASQSMPTSKGKRISYPSLSLGRAGGRPWLTARRVRRASPLWLSNVTQHRARDANLSWLATVTWHAAGKASLLWPRNAVQHLAGDRRYHSLGNLGLHGLIREAPYRCAPAIRSPMALLGGAAGSRCVGCRRTARNWAKTGLI